MTPRFQLTLPSILGTVGRLTRHELGNPNRSVQRPFTIFSGNDRLGLFPDRFKKQLNLGFECVAIFVLKLFCFDFNDAGKYLACALAVYG